MLTKQIHDHRYRALVARLAETRKSLGLTQAQVAEILGLCRTWVGKVEQCELGLDLLHFVRLCRVYGLQARDTIKVMENP